MSEPLYTATKDLVRANREFYRAFEQLDLDAMRAVWLDDPSIKCVHPGGEMLVGPERVHESWRGIFEATDRIRFELADVEAGIGGEIGWVTQVEAIRSVHGDDEFRAEAVSTNVYRMHEGRWRLVLHHASPVERRFFEPGE